MKDAHIAALTAILCLIMVICGIVYSEINKECKQCIERYDNEQNN